MQIEHKTEKGTLLFLKMENDYSIAGLNDGHIYFWTSSLFQSMGDYPLCVEIPNGKFEYIGLTSDVTEEQAKMMLPLIKRVYGQSYYDYTVKFKVGYGYVGTALESFKSLMKDKQIYEVNPFGTKQPLIENDYTNQELRSGWDEKQSLCGRWIVLFKPND